MYSPNTTSSSRASIEPQHKLALVYARVQRIRYAVIAGFVLLAGILAYWG